MAKRIDPRLAEAELALAAATDAPWATLMEQLNFGDQAARLAAWAQYDAVTADAYRVYREAKQALKNKPSLPPDPETQGQQLVGPSDPDRQT